MKPILAILVIVAMAACTRKATPTAATPEQPNTPVPTRPAPPELKPDAQQVVGFQKTACFGKCPVYQVKIYDNGQATWFGQAHVQRLGWHTAKVSAATIQAIRDKASQAGFWDLAGEYPQGYKIADLPSTVTLLRKGDTEKIVVNTHQAPEALEAFEDYLEGVVTSFDWKPATNR